METERKCDYCNASATFGCIDPYEQEFSDNPEECVESMFSCEEQYNTLMERYGNLVGDI
jgi:hypothetical protein